MPVADRVAFSLFGIKVYWYGLIIVFALVSGILISSLREERFGLAKDTSINLALAVIPAAIICARIYYVIFNLDHYIEDPKRIFMLREGGLAVYGGVIGGIIAVFVCAKRKRLSFASLLDLFSPALALGQAIGRWGNFFNQEAYGIPAPSARLCFFPVCVYIESIGEWRLAAFFYESVWCFALAAALLIMERKKAFRKSGNEFLLYIALYSFERMFVEGIREDSLYLGSVRVSQALSVMLFVTGTILFIKRNQMSNGHTVKEKLK